MYVRVEHFETAVALALHACDANETLKIGKQKNYRYCGYCGGRAAFLLQARNVADNCTGRGGGEGREKNCCLSNDIECREWNFFSIQLLFGHDLL